jgi:hypothetical protein
MLLSDSLSFLLLWFDTTCPLAILFAFIFCVQNILENLFIVLAWWSYIVLVSAYHGRFLSLHLFDSFAR